MSISKMTRLCFSCGKRFRVYKERQDHLPAGVCLELEDGRRIDICTNCILSDDRYEELVERFSHEDI